YENLGTSNTIDLADIDFTQYSLVAQVNPDHPDAETVKSVKFESSLGNQTENIEPYALFGDTKGNYKGKILTAGDFTLKATAYTQKAAGGTAIASTDLSYTVVDAAAPGPDPIPDPDPVPDPDLTPPTPEPPSNNPFETSLIGQADYVVSHFDGNNRDPDDISALPVAAALTNAAGFADKSVFFYNNNVGQPNNPSQVSRMRESAAFAEQLGIQTHDYQADLAGTTQELATIFNSGKNVLVLEGGRMEMTYRALEQTDPGNLKNITLLSHSLANENYNLGGTRTWRDLKRDFSDVTFMEISDQNGQGNSGFNSSQWSWLDSTDDPVLQEARALMLQAGNSSKVNDPSDAGMHFYGLTGDEQGNPAKAQDFFEQYPPTAIVEADSLDVTAGTDALIGLSEQSQLAGDPDAYDELLNIANASDAIGGTEDLMGGGGDFIPLDMAALTTTEAVDTASLGSSTLNQEQSETDPFGEGLPISTNSSPLEESLIREPVTLVG
ncbi:MAG: hypothetical protein AAGG53_04470, partial [Cyanobacteria bacterium P01_H01_bin.152]